MYGEKPDFLKSRYEVEGGNDDSRTIGNNESDDDTKLALFRKRFRGAVEASQRWQDEAHEDFAFVAGKQWTDEQAKSFEESNRPPIVINKIRPRISIVSGYQRLNRLDISFLARTNDDVELAHVRTGVTKYILDRCDYEAVESQAFLDCAIGGLGWFAPIDVEKTLKLVSEVKSRDDFYERRAGPSGHERQLPAEIPAWRLSNEA